MGKNEIWVGNHHMAVCVRSQLAKTDAQLRREWKGAITTDDGVVLFAGRDIRKAFADELAKGSEFVPFGDCNDFDPKVGCRGHKAPAEVSRG